MDDLTKFIKTAYSLLKQDKATKFKIGDWVNYDRNVCKVESIYTDGVHEDMGQEYDASMSTPVYVLRLMEEVNEGTDYKPSSTVKLAYAQHLRSHHDDDEREMKQVDFDTCSFIKLADGRLLVYGIYSSYYIDMDEDILTAESHAKFAVGVNAGEYPYPDIYIAHVEVPVGKTSMIDYDTEGFAIFGGEISKDWTPYVESVIDKSLAMGIQLGLSHGFYSNTVEYDDEGFMTKYVSHEISILPLFPATLNGKRTTSASNKYTALLSEDK